MLVQIVIVESGDRRLKDVGRGGGAGRHSPAPIPEEQCGLCLGSCEAELAGEGLAEPGSRIFPKFPKALRDVVVQVTVDGAGHVAHSLSPTSATYGPVSSKST